MEKKNTPKQKTGKTKHCPAKQDTLQVNTQEPGLVPVIVYIPAERASALQNGLKSIKHFNGGSTAAMKLFSEESVKSVLTELQAKNAEIAAQLSEYAKENGIVI